MKVVLIAGMAENRVIGKDNALPWDLPNDLKHFRERTKGHPIIMGRKTYESIGRPLPHRRNIVVSRQEGLQIDGVEVVSSLERALDVAKQEGNETIYVIGGAEIYRQALPFANVLELTTVHAQVEGDAEFPEFSPDEWTCVWSEPHHADAEHSHAYTFQRYEKVSS